MSKTSIATALGLFTAATILGFSGGRATSFDYSKAATAQNFLVVYGTWQRMGDGGKLTLRAGNRLYTFASGDDRVQTHFLSAVEISRNPVPKLDFDKDFEKLVALTVAPAAETGVIATIAGVAEKGPVRLLTGGERGLLTIITLGATGIGYYFGHKSEPDYDNQIFQATLQDVTLWRSIEHDWRTAYYLAVALRMRSANTGKPATEPEFLRKVFNLHPEIEAQVSSDPLPTATH